MLQSLELQEQMADEEAMMGQDGEEMDEQTA